MRPPLCLFAQEYGRPKSKNAKSVDAILQPNSIFQMTVSRTDRKEVLLSGLNACCAGMIQKRDLNFYVVVPSTVFNNFKGVSLQPANSSWPAAMPADRHWLLSIAMPETRRQREELRRIVREKVALSILDDDALAEMLQLCDIEELQSLADHGITVVPIKPIGVVKVWKVPQGGPNTRSVEAEREIYRQVLRRISKCAGPASSPAMNA